MTTLLRNRNKGRPADLIRSNPNLIPIDRQSSRRMRQKTMFGMCSVVEMNVFITLQHHACKTTENFCQLEKFIYTFDNSTFCRYRWYGRASDDTNENSNKIDYTGCLSLCIAIALWLTMLSVGYSWIAVRLHFRMQNNEAIVRRIWAGSKDHQVR